MATPPRQYLPKARLGWGCGSAGGAPPEGGTPRRCPFLNTAGDAAQWDPRREKHAPLFVPQGSLVPFPLRIRPGKHSVWCLGCLGVLGPRFDSRFPLKLPSGYPVPKCHAAGSQLSLPKSPQGSPVPPNSKARLTPLSPGGFPLRSAPSEEGAKWQTFVLNV